MDIRKEVGLARLGEKAKTLHEVFMQLENLTAKQSETLNAMCVQADRAVDEFAHANFTEADASDEEMFRADQYWIGA